MTSEFSVNIEKGKAADLRVLHIKGELDEVSVEKLKQEVDTLNKEAVVKKLVFELSNLDFINSKGIGYLVSVHSHLSKEGKEMVLVSAKEAVMDVLSLVGLTSIIPYHETMEEALV